MWNLYLWPIRTKPYDRSAQLLSAILPAFYEDCETTTYGIVLTNMFCLRKHINNVYRSNWTGAVTTVNPWLNLKSHPLHNRLSPNTIFWASQEQYQWDRQLVTGWITSLDISQILRTLTLLRKFCLLLDILCAQFVVQPQMIGHNRDRSVHDVRPLHRLITSSLVILYKYLFVHDFVRLTHGFIHISMKLYCFGRTFTLSLVFKSVFA